MGRPEGIDKESSITAYQIANHLLAECKTLSAYSSFMFGSTVSGLGRDIDILVVGPDGEPLKRLKKEFEVAGRELPLHVLYMLPSEAEETGFVDNEGCIPLASLALSGQ